MNKDQKTFIKRRVEDHNLERISRKPLTSQKSMIQSKKFFESQQMKAIKTYSKADFGILKS